MSDLDLSDGFHQPRPKHDFPQEREDGLSEGNIAGAVRRAFYRTSGFRDPREKRSTRHITVGFYMTMSEMIGMMVKFSFASVFAAIIVMTIWFLVFSVCGVSLLEIIRAVASHSLHG